MKCSLRLKANSYLRTPVKIKEEVNHYQYPIKQCKCSHSPGRSRTIKRNGNKAKWKPQGSNNKSCSSMCSTQESYVEMCTPNNVGSPARMTLLVAALKSFLLGWLCRQLFSDVTCSWLLHLSRAHASVLNSLSLLHTLPSQGHTAWPPRSSEI